MRLTTHSTTMAATLLALLSLGALPKALAHPSGAQSNSSMQSTPDNSAINARDKDRATLTPEQQSNTASDRKLLASVRTAVVHDRSLSATAHNAKIMVASGAVTLRGPVNTSAEKDRVENLVKQVDGVERVDNQLDVTAH